MSGDFLMLIPSVIAFLIQLTEFYTYKERDYKQDIENLEKANKFAEAATIEDLLESKIATISYEGGDESGLRDKYLEFIYKLHKHAKLDIELASLRRVYKKAGGIAVLVFILAISTTVVFVSALSIFRLVNQWITVAVLCWGLVLLAASVICFVVQRIYIRKLDTMKERGDLVI